MTKFNSQFNYRKSQETINVRERVSKVKLVQPIESQQENSGNEPCKRIQRPKLLANKISEKSIRYNDVRYILTNKI